MRRFSSPSSDIWLFLICIPLISAFNYSLTYSPIRLNGFLLATFTLDTLQGYLAWLGVRYVLKRLDQSWPMEQGKGRRVLFQIAITTCLGLLIIALLTELVSWLVRGKGVPLHFYTHDLPIISIWFPAINGYYIGLYYYRAWQNLRDTALPSPAVPPTEAFLVQYGKQEVLLEPDQIAGFYVEGDYVAVCNREGRRYYTDQSLDKIEGSVSHAAFFRLNRQYLLHRKTITGFKRAENGKLLVMLRPQDGFPAEITVSRSKAPSFKAWFRSA